MILLRKQTTAVMGRPNLFQRYRGLFAFLRTVRTPGSKFAALRKIGRIRHQARDQLQALSIGFQIRQGLKKADGIGMAHLMEAISY